MEKFKKYQRTDRNYCFVHHTAKCLPLLHGGLSWNFYINQSSQIFYYGKQTFTDNKNLLALIYQINIENYSI